MIILQINNWDSVEIFRLNTNDSLIDAIQGILLSPFAHSSNKHLINNVVPLFFLMSLLRYIFDKFSSILFLLLYILTGLFIWRFIPNHSVIGASGVLYSMISFLFFSGLIRGNRELLGYSLLIVFLYGGMVWGMFPFSVAENVSWEGHLMGFIVGFLLSILFRKKGPQKKVYDWENDELNNDDSDNTDKTDDDHFTIKYHYSKD